MESSRKVLVILENGAIATDIRMQREILALRDAGYGVSLIAPREREEEGNWEADGVSIYRYKRAAGGGRIWSYLFEYAYSWLATFFLSIKALLNQGFDVIHSCNPPDIFFSIALLFKPLGKKLLFDQHDLSPELYLARFERPRKLVYRALLFLERMSYRLADVTLTTNASYKRIASSRGGVPGEKIFIVRNGPYLYPLEFTVAADPGLKKGYKWMVCCMGQMSPQDGIEHLLSAADHLINTRCRRDILFVLIGNGPSAPELRRAAREFGIEEHVIFTGWISDKRLILEYLLTADVCVSPEPKSPLNEHSTFIKVLDYMAVGKPIVAFDLAETRISAGEAALYARPNDDADLAAKILEFLDDGERARRAGDIGRRRVETALAWKHVEPNLIKAYDFLFSAGKESGEVEVERFTGIKSRFRKFFKNLVSLMPLNSLRVLCLRLAGYPIGNQVWIGRGLLIVDDCNGREKLRVGDRVALAPRVSIVLQSYPNNALIGEWAPTRRGDVFIGEDTWIGIGAIILPGIRISKQSVVGAGSVVTKDVAAGTVVAGVPAKPLRKSDGLGRLRLPKQASTGKYGN